MIRIIVRFIKRIAILLPGVVVTFFSAQQLYPLLDKRIPAWVAVLVIYALVAYVFIPAAIRVINLVVQPKHIPLYCTTPDGQACDPVNIGIVGTRKELEDVLVQAGWYKADPRTPKNILRFMAAMIFKHPYPQAPFSKLYLFGRSQDVGFELPVGDSPRHRHHVRFWGVTETDDPEYRQHTFFWKRYHKSPKPGKVLWVGAASLDLGLGIIRHNAQMTHRIHHDTNAERSFLLKKLKATGLVNKTRYVRVGAPYQLRNRVINGYMQSDGRMVICEL